MKDNPQEWLPVVDETGAVTGRASRGECHGGSMLLHPVVHLHVFSPDGRLYLQKRPMWKDIQPGRWDTAVGGHVDWGETPDEALRREAREELGLEPESFDARFMSRYVFASSKERELVHVFTATVAVVPRPTAELDGGCFFTREDILARLGTGFFTPNFEQEWQRFFGPEEF